MSSNPRLFHSICNTICSSHHLTFFSRGTPPLSVHTACLHGHSPSLSSQLSPFDIKALCHESAYSASVASLVLMAIHSFGGKKCNFREYLQKYFLNRLSWSDLLTNYQQNGNRAQCTVGRPSTAERGRSLGSDF